jgi:2'-5' RNA ligase
MLPEEDEDLRVLHERLTRQVRHAGLTALDAAGWIPHLTIAREATGARPPRDAQPIRWHVSEFVLVWSRMAPVWRHEVLARYPARPSSH